MIFRRQLIISVAVLLLVFSVLMKVEAASLLNVPLNASLSDFNRETYRFIERLLNKRLLPCIPRVSLPLTRQQVVSLLMEVYRKEQNKEITPECD